MHFKDFKFSQNLLKLIEKEGYRSVYPIQEKVIPAIMDKRDILGIAKTGSGKTAGFVLPIISNFRKQNPEAKDRNIQILVLVPTRELAIQISDVFHLFKNGSREEIIIKSVYGGVSINPQMKAMHGVDILVATPGRLLDLVQSNALSLSKVKILVLDEADKMLNLGFAEEMNKILSLLPTNRQNLLFSATLSKNIDSISKIFLSDPLVIKINEENEDNTQNIKQYGYFVNEEKKGSLLRYLIKEKNMQRVLIFTSSIYQTNNVTNKLNKNGIQAIAFHSKKSQNARINALKKFKEGEIQALVTTNLLSRGIDIEKLPYVINYELPRSPKDYIHRIGRTGRAESKGEAISLVSPSELAHFKVILKKMNLWVDMIDSDSINLKGY